MCAALEHDAILAESAAREEVALAEADRDTFANELTACPFETTDAIEHMASEACLKTRVARLHVAKGWPPSTSYASSPLRTRWARWSL